MKTLPLIKSHLKGFLRNWKSVILLLGVPLLLVLLIVASFNTQGLTKTPFGVVNQDIMDIQIYEDTYLSFLDMSTYDTIDSCLQSVRMYEEYGCIDVRQTQEKTEIIVHFDNTHEPIIWEILQRIETTVEMLQQQQSEVVLTSLLSETASTQESITFFKEGIQETDGKLTEYSDQLSELYTDVSSARRELTFSLNDMERDLNDIEADINEMDRDRRETYDQSMSIVYDARQVESTLPEGEAKDEFSDVVDEMSDEINRYNTEAYQSIRNSRDKIQTYRQTHQQGEVYVNDLYELQNQISATQQDIRTQQSEMGSYQQELQDVSERLGLLGSTNTDAVLRSMMLTKQAVFVPQFDIPENIEDVSVQDINQAQSLVSLQTLYPTILFLVMLFLSLLIATFLALQEINSSASSRIRLIPNMFMREFFSTYVSSLIIAFIPVFCVLIAGEYLFSLQILPSLFSISAIVILLSSVFIFLGMSIAYVLRKESITLLLSTFLLVFFMFFSGFLYPIERMNPFFGFIANTLPPKVGLNAFNQAVFYQQSFAGVFSEISVLVSWLLLAAGLALLTKFVRRQ